MSTDQPEIKDTWIEVRSHLQSRNSEALIAFLELVPHGETGFLLSRLDEEEQHLLLDLVGPEYSAELLAQISEAQAVEIIEDLPSKSAAAIVDELDSDEAADILGELDDKDAEAILQQMDPEGAIEARKLINFDWNSAGGIMITEFVSFPEHTTTRQVLEDLRRNRDVYADYDVQYIYITHKDKRLCGVLKLRDMLLAPDTVKVGSLMETEVVKVTTSASLMELREIFEGYNILGIPVTDERNHLVGVVRRAAVEEAVGEEATDDFLKMSGLSSGEELRSMPVFERARGRLAWLVIGLFLSLGAASVIAAFEHIMQEVIILAAFLPVVANLSGASGNQAVAVSIRELTLGLVKPWEVPRVFLQEIGVGAINGLGLGLILGLVILLWKGNIYLALVVGGAMFINGTIAATVGGCIPLLLKWAKRDPALSSGPFVTTVSDACGFFITLMLATLMLKHLVPAVV